MAFFQRKKSLLLPLAKMSFWELFVYTRGVFLLLPVPELDPVGSGVEN